MGISENLLTGSMGSNSGGLLFCFDRRGISVAEQDLKLWFDLDAIAPDFMNYFYLIETRIGATFPFLEKGKILSEGLERHIFYLFFNSLITNSLLLALLFQEPVYHW